jgi:hypothetical protein
MKFRAHETFSIRKGWLSKGMKQIVSDPSVFVSKDRNPMDVLGIGANMVKSLRYWLPTVGLSESPKNKGTQHLTEFGEIVYKCDPYIEENGTLWLLHYHLVKRLDTATSWHFFFNHFQLSEFSKEDFTTALANYAKINGVSEPPIRSLDDDFNCIINTYMPRYKTAPSKDEPESNMDCPLSELGLVDYHNKKERTYKKAIPAAHTIDPLIAVAVIVDNANGRTEIPLSEIQNKHGNIGRVFNLDTITLLTVLNAAERAGYVEVVRTAGLDLLHITTPYTFLECVQQYYDKLS